jgi:hypothetical protein
MSPAARITVVRLPPVKNKICRHVEFRTALYTSLIKKYAIAFVNLWNGTIEFCNQTGDGICQHQ